MNKYAFPNEGAWKFPFPFAVSCFQVCIRMFSARYIHITHTHTHTYTHTHTHAYIIYMHVCTCTSLRVCCDSILRFEVFVWVFVWVRVRAPSHR